VLLTIAVSFITGMNALNGIFRAGNMPKLVEIWNGKAEKSQNALSPAPVTKETESQTNIAEIKSKKANGEDITKRKQKWVNEVAEIVYEIVQQVGRNRKPGMTLEELREWCMAAMSSIPRGYRDSVAGLVAQRLWAIAQFQRAEWLRRCDDLVAYLATLDEAN
jgi:hypothetical protein